MEDAFLGNSGSSVFLCNTKRWPHWAHQFTRGNCNQALSADDLSFLLPSNYHLFSCYNYNISLLSNTSIQQRIVISCYTSRYTQTHTHAQTHTQTQTHTHTHTHTYIYIYIYICIKLKWITPEDLYYLAYHHHHHHHHHECSVQGQVFTTNPGTEVAVLCKGRSSTANSGIKVAVLLGINIYGSFLLLLPHDSLFSIWTDLRRSGKITGEPTRRWGEWIWLTGSSGLHRNSPQG